MRFLFLLSLLCATHLLAQKKPLTHDVYDSWQNIATPNISNNGQYVVYNINPQEGDGVLVIQRTDNSYKKEIARGYGATISEDNRFVIFKIRPTFKETRDARIKKKRPDEMPKDSMGIVELGKDSVLRIAKVKSFKTPEKAGTWLAYLLEKPDAPAAAKPATAPVLDSATQLAKLLRAADSLVRVSDSLRNKVAEAKTNGLAILAPAKKKEEPKKAPADEEKVEEGTELVVRNLQKGEEKKFKLVSEYYFSKKGNKLVIETTRKNGDTLSQAMVLWMDMATMKVDTVMKKFNNAANYAMDEAGSQLAFVAERDSVQKALRKFHKLWHYKPGFDSAQMRVERQNAGLGNGYTVSADFQNYFSNDGKRLFLGRSPIREPKDTNIYDFETARLDVWTTNDDYLMPQQLVNLNNELKRSYLSLLDDGSNFLYSLSDEKCETVVLPENQKGDYAFGISTFGFRQSLQWDVNGLETFYLINLATRERKKIVDSIKAAFNNISPDGKYIYWYDFNKRNYFVYDIAAAKIRNISAGIKLPLWDEEDDHPDVPPPHGIMKWQEDDQYLYVYDRYDIWRLDPLGVQAPLNWTGGWGRKKNYTYRKVNFNNFRRDDEPNLKKDQTILLAVFDNATKEAGLKQAKLNEPFQLDEQLRQTYPVTFAGYMKAKQSHQFGYLVGSPTKSYNLKMVNAIDTGVANGKKEIAAGLALSDINQQQKDYNWNTVELHKWKMLDGKMSEGLLYKPENFDSTKKYPVIFYFYERNADTRYAYRAPAPSASTINTAYFTSNGYLVFDPNIYYKNGEPGQSAYNSIISAVKYLKKFKFVDTAHIGIQGQSWGGYQTAYLITKSKLFAAAGAGAPVSNMTSAYGGIRWGTGISRQFQYEHSQSRLGATPWQRLDLYIKNSPLFFADKVTTPVLIMHNDKDGAVPWWQGIEFFSALKRLGKTAYLLQYNEEDHNLVERRNRKDLSIRLSQFFDHYLKGAAMPKWMKQGVPATSKGVDWGTGF
jgi:dienelactone hydrolase